MPDAIGLKAALEGARSAVVMGAGFIGLEAAEALGMQGLRTSVVELAPHVLPPLEPKMAQLVRDELVRLGIEIHDGVSANAVEQGHDHDVVVLSDGTRIDADIIVLSVGVRPDTRVWEAVGVTCDRGAILIDELGHAAVENVWAVGDATSSADVVTGARRPVALAGPADRAGRLVADAIMGKRGHVLPGLAGTAIVRVGELTAVLTGANRRSLDEAGVDKRIDGLSVDIKAGFTVHDLMDLDLAYSSPYGSAKDPVNMAGMMGCNVLDGTLKLWHAQGVDDVLASSLVLDVRSADDMAQGHLPGSLNVPHIELRDRMDEVSAAANGRPVSVLCASGVRSYLALRQLDHAGLQAANLSGSSLTLQAALGDRAKDVIVTS